MLKNLLLIYQNDYDKILKKLVKDITYEKL